MNWKILVDTFHEGYHIGFLHRDSLKEVLHGNVTDFEAFGLNHRLVMPRKKLERLKSRAGGELGPDVEYDAHLRAVPQHAAHSAGRSRRARARSSRAKAASIAPSWTSRFYVPKAPATEEERTHWDKNMQLVLDVVTGEDFPAGRTIQIGLTSGAQTHRGLRPQRAGHDPLSPVDARLPRTLRGRCRAACGRVGVRPGPWWYRMLLWFGRRMAAWWVDIG